MTFTRKEKNGALVVLFFVLLFLIIPFIYPFIFKGKFVQASDYKKEINELQAAKNDTSKGYAKRTYDDDNYQPYNASDNYNETPKGELFYFDPNTLSVEGWQKLGVKEKTAIGIQHYTAKGGKFKQPDDIKKIWGLKPDLVERLLPYVRIAATETASNYENKSYAGYEHKAYEKKVPTVVDINSGDTSAYIALPGIGSKLAARIITFRDKLGGFYNVNQIGETFGLPDSTFQKIKPFLKVSGEGIKQININTATQDELKAHPYIRWQLANVIFQYRTQHGNFSSVNDLKKIMVITDEIFNKVSPYLKIN